jgi:hypothetical protein
MVLEQQSLQLERFPGSLPTSLELPSSQRKMMRFDPNLGTNSERKKWF